MKIDMSYDVEKYEEDVIAGFSLKQVVPMVGALIVGAACMAFCYFVLHIHILVAAYIMMPIMAPIAMKGLNKDKKGSILKDIFGMGKKTKPLVYQSTEVASSMNQYENKEQTNEKRKKGISWTKLFRIH